jgi:hypothetical protein
MKKTMPASKEGVEQFKLFCKHAPKVKGYFISKIEIEYKKKLDVSKI